MARGLGLELSSVPGTEGPGKQGGTGWWPSALAGEPRRVERDRAHEMGVGLTTEGLAALLRSLDDF